MNLYNTVRNGKLYHMVETKYETFTQFCERIGQDLGETLYKKCDPFLSEGRIYIHLPEGAANRVKASVTNLCNVELHYYKYGNINNI